MEASAAAPSATLADVPEGHLEAWRSLLTAHAALVERIEAALGEERLPPLGWYDVLCALHRAPERTLRPRELGLHLTISKSGLTRLMDRIVAAGLIERRECESDRRGHLVVLTDSGEAMLRGMWPVFSRALERHFASRLTSEEAETLTVLLGRLREGACRDAGAL